MLGKLFGLGAMLFLACSPAARAQLCSPPELAVDVRNCGTCGNDCRAGSVNANFACVASQCQFTGCQSGFYDLDNNGTCEYACTFRSAQEECNGLDDDCDGQVDETPVAPSVVQACGVSPLATAPECTAGSGGVQLTCQNGAWQCGFSAGVCTGGNCAATAETCDTLDNNCDGRLNENVPLFGRACASDDGRPPPGDGACRTTGVYVCSGPGQVSCSAVTAPCATLPGGCQELCNGQDDDCDGLVDEPFSNRGTGAGFVKPAVTKIGSAPNRWIYQYEASRPSAAGNTQGRGNGFVTSAPVGEQLQKTPACSVAGALPWTGVTGREAEQICASAGGTLCTRAQLQQACTPNAACLFGYNPRGPAGSACATGFTGGTKFCNLSPSFDADGNAGNGIQNLLVVGGAPVLANCWSDWSGLQSNTTTSNKLFDVTGNVRELTKEATNDYRLIGGSYLQRSETGAQCNVTTFSADQDFQYHDTGFRCCFGTDPTL